MEIQEEGEGANQWAEKKVRRGKNNTEGREERFLAAPLPLSDVLFLHLFFVSSLLLSGAFQTEALFSKTVTIFDLDSNQYSEVVLARKRPLWNHRGYYIRSRRFSHTGKDKYKIMGLVEYWEYEGRWECKFITKILDAISSHRLALSLKKLVKMSWSISLLPRLAYKIWDKWFFFFFFFKYSDFIF